MKLLELTLYNWGPFKGTQTLDLSTREEAPIVLVHGENMRGKTSLMRAMRWALYGTVTAHDGSKIPEADFANYDLRDSGEEFEYGAKLLFEHRGKSIEIERKNIGRGTRGLIDTHLTVTRQPPLMKVLGGHPVPERDIDEMIQRILHPDISEFFLFDGEMLSRFEEKLRGEGSSGFIRNRIEMALGIPALRLIRGDLAYLYDETSAALRRSAKAEKLTQGLGTRLETAEANVNRSEEDLEALKQGRDTAAQIGRVLGDELSKVESIKAAFYKRSAAETSRDSYIRDRDGSVGELKQRMESSWWLPLRTILGDLAYKAQQDLDETLVAGTQRGALEIELGSAETQIHETRCRTCGQEMPEQSLSHVQHRIVELRGLLEALPLSQDPAELGARARRLRPYLNIESAVEQITNLEKDVKRANLRSAEEKSVIDSLTQLLEGNEIDIAALEKQYQDARLTEREAEEHISEVEKALSGFRREQADVTRQLAENTPSAEGPRAELQVVEELQTAVDGAISEFRDVMRQKIQSEASSIFTKLTTEEDYSGLRIDGNYYLNIVDDKDRVISRRSAGADQVVTMSLIGALARCSVEEGPIVMDTPFGRLDRGHRNKILRWVSTLGGQAVLFVQSGEFERDRDLVIIEGRVGREYVLRRLGATSTRIEVIGNE